MQRLFFHNQHDQESREILKTLPEDYKVYRAFEPETVIPSEILLTYLPYKIDKQLVLETEGPYIVGTFVLTLKCYDYKNGFLASNDTFHISVNDGGLYSLRAKDGVIEIEIDCEHAGEIELSITGNEYYPLIIKMEAVDSD